MTARAQEYETDPNPASERCLTLEEAAHRYNFPAERLRRRLQGGGVPGAYLDAGGVTWWIPETSLAGLGYRPVGGAVAAPASAGLAQPAGFSVLAAGLRQREAVKRSELETSRAELEATRAAVVAERSALEMERAELEAERARLAATRRDAPTEVLVEAQRPKPRQRKIPNWVEPNNDICPVDYPVKAKFGSKLYYLPGTSRYRSVRPDRCYRSPEAALEDGLREPPQRTKPT